MDYYKLFKHILQEHELLLYDDEINEIVRIVLEMDDSEQDILHYYPLFEHMDEEYGITLLEGQLSEIIRIVLEMHNEKPEKCTEAIKEPSNNDQMKTAMQQYIERLKEKRSAIYESFNPLGHLKYVNYLRFMITEQLNENIEMAESMLKEEREQIINAYMEGCSDSIFDGRFDEIRAEQYYTETHRKL